MKNRHLNMIRKMTEVNSSIMGHFDEKDRVDSLDKEGP